MRCSTAFSLLLLALPLAAEEPSLSFQVSGREVARLTTIQLSKKAAPTTVRFLDPHLGKEKRYRCWPIKAVMDAAFGPGWTGLEQSEAVLSATDGYASVSSASKLAEAGGCLAFEDLDVKGWEPVGRKNSNPGPYYLVWTGPEQSTEKEFPWPWQLASINLVRIEERYPEVVPAGAAPGSPAQRGFAIFKGRCLRCHSINRDGGKIGPDLNAPKSVTSYRTKRWIKSYVRAPSEYRYTEMPDHRDMSDRDLEDVYAYLKLKAKQPEKPPF